MIRIALAPVYRSSRPTIADVHAHKATAHAGPSVSLYLRADDAGGLEAHFLMTADAAYEFAQALMDARLEATAPEPELEHTPPPDISGSAARDAEDVAAALDDDHDADPETHDITGPTSAEKGGQP